MKLSDRIKGAYKVLTTQNLGNSISGSIIRNYGFNSSFNPKEQVRGITYKAIDKIGASLSVYRPIINRRNGESLENHPLYNLFDNPNPMQTASDFVHLYAMLYEIYGETFWYLVRGENTRKVKEVYLLNPASIELKIENGELYGYILHKVNGEQVPFLPEEIIHDKRPNPFNEWRGMSVLERASVYVDTELTTSTFTLNYMKNNASPSGIVSLPNMDKETFKQFAAQWREGYEGPENAGKTAFIRGGEASFKAVGATLKDVDAKVTREMAKEDVLMMLEVPKPLLGAADSSGLGRGNVETLHYIFAHEKLEPLMDRLDRIYYKILGTFGITSDQYSITHISPVPEDKEYILKQSEAGVNVWLTVNEVRQMQGLPAIDGGDNLIQNATQVTEGIRHISLKKEVKKTLNEEQEEFRSKLVSVNDKYERKFKSSMSKFANDQYERIIKNINASSKSYEEWLFSVKEESEELADVLSPIILALMAEQAKDVANFITGEVLTITPEIERTVKANILKISGVFNEDTIVALEKTLTEGSSAGESLVKLKKRVEGVYIEAKGYRAERIARTESLRASNDTAELTYKQSGYKTVRWFANPGACDFCASLNGTVKTIGKNFLNLGDVYESPDGKQLKIDYTNINVPPLHPNCSCSIVPED